MYVLIIKLIEFYIKLILIYRYAFFLLIYRYTFLMFEIFGKIFFNGREKIFFAFWNFENFFLGFL